MHSHIRILVVDDNPATLYSTSRVLRSAGWRVLEAGTGSEALAQVSQGVDLVVLDVNLPDIDGFEVCRRLRRAEATARLPVVHLSATFVADSDKVHGFEAGADGYLTHPVEPPVLIATVKAYLRTREAENEVRRSEAKFRAVFDNAINGIALLTTELAYLDVNPSMCALLQRPLQSIVGLPLLDFVQEEHQEQAAHIDDALRQRGAWRGVLPFWRCDGEPVHLEWNISHHSEPHIWLAIVSDVTARIHFEREREELLLSERAARTDAERANQLKDDFLATLSHELRTPLSAIVGWSQVLKMSGVGSPTLTEAVEAIDRNAKAQVQLIDDLLDVSRITSGKLRLDVQSVDPSTLVEGALSAILPAAEAKGIQVSKALDPTAGPVHGDPTRLQQIVWNLVNNAVKFTSKGGRVHVTLKRADTHIELAVADTGIGINSHLKTRIFERFRQGDSSTTREYGGLGLGLAICKQLVEMHGGSIYAESEGENRGSTFFVVLPISPFRAGEVPDESRPSSSGQAVARRADPAKLSGVRVLLVDDDPDARSFLMRIVSESGAESKVVDSVAHALAAIDEFQPQVLVSDLGMPVQDGFDLIRELRARGHGFKELPAIALTAYARPDDRRRVLMAGYQVHIPKPVDPRELTAAIAALVGRTGRGM
ncbi:MAG: response regulator [Pirellulaceae bacterium]